MSGNLYRPATMLAVSLSTEGHSALSSANKYHTVKGEFSIARSTFALIKAFWQKMDTFGSFPIRQ